MSYVPVFLILYLLSRVVLESETRVSSTLSTCSLTEGHTAFILTL